MSSESRKIDLGTHALRVRESGSGERTFVLLHDYLGTTAIWDAMAPALNELGRVIRVQQRGHGDSTAPEGTCTVADLGGDVARLLELLALPQGQTILIGHRIGGVAALHAALRAPQLVGSLALLSTPAAFDDRTAKNWPHVVRAGEVNKLQGLARSMFGPMSRREVDGDGIALTEIARALSVMGTAPLTPGLAVLDRPVLVVAGERDAAGVASARTIAGELPRGTLAILPGADEVPHVTAAAEVVARVRELAATRPA